MTLYPPPNQQSDRFPLDFVFKGPQTELRTLSQIANMQLSEIANRQNYEQASVFSDSTKSWRKFKGATRLGTTGLGASERESAYERVSERTSENLWKSLKTSEKPLKTSQNAPSQRSSQKPLRGRFHSQRLSVLLPLYLCALYTLRRSLLVRHDFRLQGFEAKWFH